jgi:Tetratricopeptide repeat
MSSESTDVVEIDAIGVDEWEHEQHTPTRAMDENLAALVKQSGTQSGPVRAPTVDDEWDADGQAEPAKQRTTTNTVARPAAPKPKTKTMALPTIAKPSAAPKPMARVETKAVVSPAAKQVVATPKTGDEPPPGFVEVKPLAARGAAKPAAKPQPAAKPTPTPAPMAVIAKPIDPKPIAKPTPAPMAVIAKPTPPPMAVVAKPTPPPMAVIAKPTPPPMAVIAKPTPPPMAVVAKPTPPPMAAIDPAPPPRAPTPLPFAPMTLPAWPPTTDFEDWDNPQSASTSVGNRISPSRPVSSDFKSEDSVIVDLNAKPTATDKPRRPQSYPVIQTSEQKPSTSGVFVMPTAAQPNATLVAPERASAPELPPPPIAGTDARASSPGWNTPLPQQLPGEPIAAPAAPSWPSAPLAHEPAAPRAAKPSLVPRRAVVIATAGATVLAIVFAIGARGSHDSPQPVVVATPAPKPASADSTPKHESPTRAGAMATPTTIAAAAADVVAPTSKPPAKPPVAMRRISRSKKPVVVDYDKKPSSSPLDADEALAQARAAYAIGNQHLFAGEGDEAVAAYRKALSIYPSYAAGYRGLGLAFAQQGDKPSAIAAFKTYVKLAPTAKDVALIQKRIRNLSVR